MPPAPGAMLRCGPQAFLRLPSRGWFMRSHLLAWFTFGVLIAHGCGGGSPSNKDASKDGAGDAASDGGGPDAAPSGPDDTSAADLGESGGDDGAVTIACASAAECPGQDSDCSRRTCNDGVCGMTFEPVGKVLASQTVGDCQVRKCD